MLIFKLGTYKMTWLNGTVMPMVLLGLSYYFSVSKRGQPMSALGWKRSEIYRILRAKLNAISYGEHYGCRFLTKFPYSNSSSRNVQTLQITSSSYNLHLNGGTYLNCYRLFSSRHRSITTHFSASNLQHSHGCFYHERVHSRHVHGTAWSRQDYVI